MAEHIYTRTGKVERNDNFEYKSPYRDFKQYRFPVRNNTEHEIRINVPLDAVKADITEIIQHLQIIADNMEQ